MNTYEKVLPATKKHMKWWNNRVIKALGAFTVLFSLISALFPQGFWPPHGYFQALVQKSFELDEDILVWSASAYRDLYANARNQNSSVMEDMDMSTNSTITEYPLTIMRGCATAITMGQNLASHIYLGIIIYFLLILVAVLNLLTIPFIERIEKTIATDVDVDEDTRQMLQAEREEVWMQYRLLIEVSKSVNDIYDPLLKTMHVANLLSYADSMSELVLEKKVTWMKLLAMGLNLGKADLTYYMAGKIADRVSLIRAKRI